MSKDPASLSVSDASDRMDRGELQATELLDAVFARIDLVEASVRSYIAIDRNSAYAAARATDLRIAQGKRIGRLDGIPYGAKDNIYSLGFATTGGSRVPQSQDASTDATVISRLRAGGAILLGKLNTWEFGTGDGSAAVDLPFPVARNPWNTDHFTGGSSTGSGVAVAAGTAMFAIGTDTGGSVRLPAAATGVVGMKPSFGRISRYGVMPNCWSFDTIGPLALTVADTALIYDTIAGYDDRDPVSLKEPVAKAFGQLTLDSHSLRIGIVQNLDSEGTGPAPAIVAALEDIAATLRDTGVKTIPVTLPVPPSEYRKVAAVINQSESASIHEANFHQHRQLMGSALKRKLEIGLAIRAVDYIGAQIARQKLTAETSEIINSVDAILLPMTYRTAPKFSDTDAVASFTKGSAGSTLSLTGHPAISIPCGFDDTGMPVAVQLATRFGNDLQLLQIANLIESLLPKVRRVEPCSIKGQND